MTRNLLLLVIAIVLFTIGALLAIVGGHVGDISAVEFAILGLPFFAAAHLP